MMRKMTITLLAGAVLALGASAPVPRLPITDLKDLPVVTTAPYDEGANADAAQPLGDVRAFGIDREKPVRAAWSEGL